MQPNEGLTLDRYLSEKGPLDPARVIRIALQVAQQLGSGASPFPVHPGRILATKEGVVRLLPPHAEDLALPAIVEFPAYASPEEIRGSQPDIRSTLYSLGCTTFELLTGTPPYGGKDPKDVLRAHVEDPVPDVRDSSLADISEGLAETLRELLEKDPELRIQSPEELVRRLRQSASVPQPTADGRTRGAGSTADGRTRGAALPGPGAGAARRGESTARPAAKAAPAPMQRRPMPSRPASPGSLPSTRPAPGRPPSALGGRGLGKSTSGRRAGEAGSKLPASRQAVGGRGLQHGRLRARQPEETGRDGFDEEVERRGAHPKKFYPFSIAGGAVGFVIGLIIVLSKAQSAKSVPAAEQAIVREQTRKDLQARKDLFNEEVKKNRSTVETCLTQLRSRPEEFRREFLFENLNKSATYPGAFELGKALLAVGAEPGTPGAAPSATAPEDAGEADSFKKQRAEAEKLYAEGKLGEARNKIYENYLTFKTHHDAEISAFMEKCDREMVERWERDKAEIDSLARQGDADKAVELCRAAMAYGDGGIRREADDRMRSIQSQTDIRRSDESTEDATDDASNKGSEDTDLDAEFEKASGGASEKAAGPKDSGPAPEGGSGSGGSSGSDDSDEL